MDKLLVRGVDFGGKTVDVLAEDGRIARISSVPLQNDCAETLDGRGRILVPPFYNGHTHASMNLLRGYADDLQLMDWLQNHIWPVEARMTEEDAYVGARLSILEMIKTGTVFFNDMYWHSPATRRAAEEMGMRCAVSSLTIETGGVGVNDPKLVAANRRIDDLPRSASSRVFMTYAPHAIYTVCEDTLRRIAAKAREEDAFVHVHVSETRGEVEDCRKAHSGMTPVEYLDSIEMLGNKTVMAHCVHVTDDDLKRIADRGAVIVHNAQSNLKLDSGFFPMKRALAAGCKVILGTDGCASNNSVSMFAEMKCASLLAKTVGDDPSTADAETIMKMATAGGASAFGINGGVIAEGKAADFLLLDSSSVFMVPGYNRASDLVYAADSSCVDTVVCNGRILMSSRKVPGEEEIISAARKAAARFRKG